MMGYYIDLSQISISEYRIGLEFGYLPPSRKILRENMQERFGYFEEIGIKNVDELLQFLKKKDKFIELQKNECLSGEYLKILLRELKSILPKPNRISEFPGISPKTVAELEKIEIKNTVKLFSRVLTEKSRTELAEETGISAAEILLLTKLTDLSRIKWVGVTFARILYDIGYDTVEVVSKADPLVLHKIINDYNKEKEMYRFQIGLNDVRIFVDVAKDVPLDIAY